VLRSWSGIGFVEHRRFVDGHPRFADGERLTLAIDDQRREFFHRTRWRAASAVGAGLVSRERAVTV